MHRNNPQSQQKNLQVMLVGLQLTQCNDLPVMGLSHELKPGLKCPADWSITVSSMDAGGVCEQHVLIPVQRWTEPLPLPLKPLGLALGHSGRTGSRGGSLGPGCSWAQAESL